MTAVHLDDGERRRRLVTRHRLDRSASSARDAVGSTVAMHSSDPVTPILGLRARVRGFSVGQFEAQMYEARTLWRLHAMRRTLWVVDAEAADLFVLSSARPVAAAEIRRLAGWLEGEVDDPMRWLAGMREAVLGALDAGEASTTALAETIPELRRTITVGSGKWTSETSVSSRVLFLMAMEGSIVRTRPAGTWRSSQYTWARTDHWFGRSIDDVDAAEARKAIVARYVAAFGPVTLTDVAWWTGWRMTEVRAALAGMTAATVGTGEQAYVVAGDEESVLDAPRAVSLLPGLDPTPMGWKGRSWYLGGHENALFDRNGNVGPTIWLDGRIVGGWAQRPGGSVATRLLEDVGAEAVGLIEAEAGTLEQWLRRRLDDAVVKPRFRTPLERELVGG